MDLRLPTHILMAELLAWSLAQGSQSKAIGHQLEASGRVIAVDLRDLPRDGDAQIMIEAGRGQRIEVRVPSGERSCEARALAVVMALAPGETIRVRGVEIGPGRLEVCLAGTLLRRL